MESALRQHRVARGLTQAQLAARAGVSRQQVAAVEAGANAPAVDAALRLARALGVTVEQLFDPGSAEQLVLAGCDPALALAASLLAESGAPRVATLSAPTGSALDWLAQGRLHGAVVHGPAGSLPVPPRAVTRLQFARWQVGLGCPERAGRAAGMSAEEMIAAEEVVQREQAASSQQALMRACARLGRPLPAGPRAGGHAESAHLGGLLGRPALTTEGAARAFGLGFLALEEHTVELWLASEFTRHPAAEALVELLGAPAFVQRAGRIGGYDLHDSGRVL